MQIKFGFILVSTSFVQYWLYKKLRVIKEAEEKRKFCKSCNPFNVKIWGDCVVRLTTRRKLQNFRPSRVHCKPFHSPSQLLNCKFILQFVWKKKKFHVDISQKLLIISGWTPLTEMVWWPKARARSKHNFSQNKTARGFSIFSRCKKNLWKFISID